MTAYVLLHHRVSCQTVWEVTFTGDSFQGNSLDHSVQHLFVFHGNCGLEYKGEHLLSTKYYIIIEWAGFSLKHLDVHASSFPQECCFLKDAFYRWTSIWDFTSVHALNVFILCGPFTCAFSLLYCLDFKLHMGLIYLSYLFKLNKMPSCSFYSDLFLPGKKHLRMLSGVTMARVSFIKKMTDVILVC